MADAVIFTLHEKPFAKQRPKWNRHSGTPYTPEETREYEKRVADEGRKHFSEPLKGPVRLRLAFYISPAKSWSQQKYQEHIGTPHAKPPDLDNLEKSIKDGLNGVAYADDAQVSYVEKWKVWGVKAQTVISVEEIG